MSSAGAPAPALLAILLAFLMLCAPTIAGAHTLTTGQVISRLRAPDMAETFDVVSVEPSPDLDRLLVIRVGEKWPDVDPELRRTVAGKWLHMWRNAIRNGIVAVLDDRSEQSLVNYDAEGNARLKSVTMPESGSEPSQ